MSCLSRSRPASRLRRARTITDLTLISVSPDFRPHFLEEVRGGEGAELLETLDEHRLLLSTTPDFRPLFCLHRFPVQTVLPVDDLELESVRPFLWEEGLSLDLLREHPYAIQVEANRRLEWSFSALVDTLIADADLPRELFSPRHPRVVLSVYLHQGPQGCRVFAGVSTVEENLSSWSSGRCRIPRDPESVSRAEGKLLEAWEAFGLEHHDFGKRRALDLGAAPGGWSRVLAGLGFRVEAVDPADLDPRVLGLPTVRHHRQTAAPYLADQPGSFDLLVSDMKMEAAMACDLLVRCAPRLHPQHGRLLTTLKLGKSQSALKESRQALGRLARGYDVLAARQLYFNRSEITVLGSPKRISPS